MAMLLLFVLVIMLAISVWLLVVFAFTNRLLCTRFVVSVVGVECFLCYYRFGDVFRDVGGSVVVGHDDDAGAISFFAAVATGGGVIYPLASLPSPGAYGYVKNRY